MQISLKKPITLTFNNAVIEENADSWFCNPLEHESAGGESKCTSE
jgi:hypothetical protein